MAMIHPSDENFALTEPLNHTLISGLFRAHLSLVPTSISSPSSVQGQYHKIYFVTLPKEGDGEWAGRKVVLRVARKTFTTVKTENEVAMISLMRSAGVPAPAVVFYSADAGTNALGYEFICMDYVPYPPLAETWQTLSVDAFDNVLSQLVGIFVKMFELDVGGMYGSLRIGSAGEIIPGPVLEETMWQLPDIDRYFHAPPFLLTSSTPSTVNPTGPFPTWLAYISAFLGSYVRIISLHPNLSHLRPLLPSLHTLLGTLDAEEHAPQWVTRLKQDERLRGRVWHRDFHLGNILVDDAANIQAVIDWEFAGVGPSFHKRSSPLSNLTSHFNYAFPSSTAAQHLISTWPLKFDTLLQARAPLIFARWKAESDVDAVLGKEGQALSDVREFLRSCVEVGVRGWGNVDKGKGEWKDVVENRLVELGCAPGET